MNKYLKISLIVVCVLAVGFLAWQIVARNKKATSQNPTANNSTSSQNTVTANNSSPSQPNNSNTSGAQTTGEKITIAKIGISAPISINVDGNNMQQYLTALEKGVDHLKQTALPGEAGNTVIFGHSSYYKNKPGDFKTVFAKLDQLAAGDIIQISSNGQNYSYKVSGSKLVKPTDVSVVAQDKIKKQLTLITCWPPKTTTNRMVVSADLE